MADEEEKKVKKQRWTVDELEILKVYAQKLEPDEKANYAEVSELLAAEGYDRKENQVQKKFERMRWEAKNNSTSMLRRLEELIEGMKYKDDEGNRTKSNPTTPRASKSDADTPQKVKWTVPELNVLLKCMIEGRDKASIVHELLPSKNKDKIRSKLTNVRTDARNQGTTAMEIVRKQIARLDPEGVEQIESNESEEEEQLLKRGTKRKLEDSSDDRSAKKQRVIESPRLPVPKDYNGAVAQDNSDLKKMLDQISNNNRINFANLRTYIRDKFEESRKENDELRSQMTMLEDKLDILTQEVRALKANNNGATSPNKVLSPSKTSTRMNGDSSRQNSEAKQQISYYNFL
jgi:hypothetical protein